MFFKKSKLPYFFGTGANANGCQQVLEKEGIKDV